MTKGKAEGSQLTAIFQYMPYSECTVMNTLQPFKNIITEAQISVEQESDVSNICFL